MKEAPEGLTIDDLFNFTLTDRMQRLRQALVRSLEFIGQLTAIDGATIITYDLGVLAFGAKIKSKNSEISPFSVVLSEPFENSFFSGIEVSVSQLGGTRHQSAAQFAFDQNASMAIVASQDGKVTIFARDDCPGTTNALTHVELLFR